MYGELVSYYDAIMDPINFYFREKISMAFSYVITMKTKRNSLG